MMTTTDPQYQGQQQYPIEMPEEHYYRSDSGCLATRSRFRATLLEAVEKDAGKVWKTLPECYRHEKEFVMRALLKSRTLPAKNDFERSWNKALRFDKEIILAFSRRSDFAQLHHDRHLFVPDQYHDDYDVMLEYCRRIPRSLQNCTEELRQNVNIVHAAVSLGGKELQYAHPNLFDTQQQPHDTIRELVEKACRSYGRALEFCPPGPLRDELIRDRNFVLNIVLQQPESGSMFKLLTPELQSDTEVVLQALQTGLRFRYCPVQFQGDMEGILLPALSRRSDLYLELPPCLQQQKRVCLTALTSDSLTPTVLQKTLHHYPTLPVEDRRVALQFCRCCTDTNLVHTFITEQAPFAMKDDEEIMQIAIERKPRLFAQASPRLQRNESIILAAIQEDSVTDVLSAVGHNTLLNHPPIAVRAIEVYPQHRQLRFLRTLIPPDLWSTNRDVAKAYIKKSGRVMEAMDVLLQPPLPPDDPDNHLLNDEYAIALAAVQDLALWVAEHAGPDFGRVGEALRGDLNFMKRAVDCNGRVIRYASPAIRNSMELLVRALANHPKSLLHRDHSNGNSVVANSNGSRSRMENAERRSVQEVEAYINSKLDLHANFVQYFLRGIAIVRYPHLPPAQRSPLAMLDRGMETSQAFKQLIAEFAGVPIGEELRVLRTAAVNLTISNAVSGGTNQGMRQDSDSTASVASTNQDNPHPAERHAAELYRLDRWVHHREERRELRQQQQQQARNNEENGPGQEAEEPGIPDHDFFMDDMMMMDGDELDLIHDGPLQRRRHWHMHNRRRIERRLAGAVPGAGGMVALEEEENDDHRQEDADDDNFLAMNDREHPRQAMEIEAAFGAAQQPPWRRRNPRDRRRDDRDGRRDGGEVF